MPVFGTEGWTIQIVKRGHNRFEVNDADLRSTGMDLAETLEYIRVNIEALEIEDLESSEVD